MKKRMPMIIALAVLAGMIALNVAVKKPEPAGEAYPMANAKISWGQTFHGGAWSE